MDRRIYAVTSVILGVGLGIIADVFFFRRWVGLSFPLYALLCTAALIGFAAIVRQKAQFRNLWLLIPLGFFALMVAVRANETLTFINVLAVLTLTALVLHYFPLKQTIDSEPLITQAMALIEAGFITVFTPVGQLLDSVGWVRERRPLHHPVAGAVVRGLVIAIPVLIVFGLLLASADQVFGQYVSRITSLFQLRNMSDILTQGMIAGFFGWFACGGLAYAALRRVDPDRRYVQVGDLPPAEIAPEPAADYNFDDANQPHPPTPSPHGEEEQSTEAMPASTQPKGKKPSFTLGMIESGIVLGLVDLMFGAFVLIQFAYFFGGEGNISATGFTYADYARRGFFELVAVSVLTLCLMLWLDYVTVRHNPAQQTIFRGLIVIIIALVGVMLWSAHVRLTLYEEAYGFTHLRLYPHVFTLWLAVLFGFFLLMLFRVRANIFSFGALLCIIGYVVTLNVINPDQTIMAQNINRFHNGSSFDLGYLRNVSEDAVPVILAFYQQNPDIDPDLRYGIGQWLIWQSLTLQSQRADLSILSAHVARDTAYAQLTAALADLPEFDRDYRLPYYSDYLYDR